jgi:hypothetical protein
MQVVETSNMGVLDSMKTKFGKGIEESWSIASGRPTINGT